jgi:predicted dehydrogenase
LIPEYRGAMAKPLGIGIVGAGVIAAAHAAAIREHAHAEVVAVFDRHPERAQDAGRQWGGARASSTLGELIAHDGVDAVIVATPPAGHAEATLAALEAGKHVLCEKPLGRTFEEAEAMVTAAEASDAFLACCSGRLRCTPAHRAARRLIEDGELGEVYEVRYRLTLLRNRPGHHLLKRATWFLDRSLSGGGALMDLGVYAVDAAMSLLDNPKVLSVAAQTYTFEDDRVPDGVIHDVEDHAVVMLRCEGGKSAIIEAAWIANMTPAANVEVLGSKAGLRLDPLTKISARPGAGDTYQPLEEPILTDPELGILAAANLRRITKQFLDQIAAGVQPITSGREALDVMRILAGAYRSAEPDRAR